MTGIAVAFDQQRPVAINDCHRHARDVLIVHRLLDRAVYQAFQFFTVD